VRQADGDSYRWPLVVVGAGPAGIAAAAEAARLGAEPLLLDSSGVPGGSVALACEVKNCPVAERDAPGPVVARHLAEQLDDWGIATTPGDVALVERAGDHLVVHTREGQRHQASAVVLATGTQARMPEVDGLPSRFGGPWFASAAEAWLEARPSHAAVLGGGDVAFDQARLLARRGTHVTVLCRSARPRAPAWLVARAAAEGVTIHTQVEALRGRVLGSGARVEWRQGDVEHAEQLDALVAAIGRRPCLPELTAEARACGALRIAGDAAGRSARHVVVAMGDGCAAAHELLRVAASR
jgi:thioredoxin reductase (NADPH)